MTADKRAWEVRNSGIHGAGVFASRKIRKGTWIIEYQGERITNDEADLRYDDDSMIRHHTFLFVVDQTICIDAAHRGNEARFINHSCDPNCEAILAEAEREIWIVARRAIEAGEELTYDYSYPMDEDDDDEARRRYPCRCGSPRCRGTIVNIASAS